MVRPSSKTGFCHGLVMLAGFLAALAGCKVDSAPPADQPLAPVPPGIIGTSGRYMVPVTDRPALSKAPCRGLARGELASGWRSQHVCLAGSGYHTTVWSPWQEGPMAVRSGCPEVEVLPLSTGPGSATGVRSQTETIPAPPGDVNRLTAPPPLTPVEKEDNRLPVAPSPPEKVLPPKPETTPPPPSMDLAPPRNKEETTPKQKPDDKPSEPPRDKSRPDVRPINAQAASHTLIELAVATRNTAKRTVDTDIFPAGFFTHAPPAAGK
jgi:hypothetical protein